jgi:hypothetical protein
MVNRPPDFFTRTYKSEVVGVGPNTKLRFLRHTGKFGKHQLIDLNFVKPVHLFYRRMDV